MKPQTILIVEDNSQMRRTLRELLGDLATVCYECSDGQAALAAYRQYRPDWVLMDLKMVEMDGLTATAAICAADPAARILIVTNYDDPALREAARQAGACGFVPKENLLELRTLISPTP
ncbi:MAG: response regulator transcription factor [Acidobacteriota bacterium]